jgi:hypothetical protein
MEGKGGKEWEREAGGRVEGDGKKEGGNAGLEGRGGEGKNKAGG